MSNLPRYVTSDTDRHGNVRYYFRKHGRKIRLPSPRRKSLFTRAYVDAATQLGLDLSPSAIQNGNSSSAGWSVYFISASDRVKIGRSRNVARRLQDLRTALPDAQLIFELSGGFDLEMALHHLFRSDRIAREWFIFSAKIRRWIANERIVVQHRRIASHQCPTVSENKEVSNG